MTCLIRTSQFKVWYSGYEGGADPYLSKTDQQYFINYITEAADYNNCIPAIIASNLTFNLRKKRIKKATHLLNEIGCSRLISHLDEKKQPCSTWIYHLILKLNLRFTNPQPLEYLRRFTCDQTSIQNFFIENWIFLNRDQRPIFNMDETMIDSNRKLKVITTQKTIPLTIKHQNYPHVTGVITICADGSYLNPFIILPNKKKKKKY